MDKKRVLILAYSHLHSDPRIQRQIKALKDHFHIETSGYSGSGDATIPFFPIYTEPPFSLKRKLKRLFQFLTQQFDQFYWDSGKKNLLNQFRSNNYDLVIANDFHTLPLAIAIADNRAKVYFDAHEYHPKEFEDNFKWRLFYQPFINYLCKKYIPKAAAFSSVSEGIANEYQAYIGLKPLVITNATHYYDLKLSDVNPDKIKLIHHGAALRSRKLEMMIEVMNFLDSRFLLDFLLTGNDSSYIRQLKKLSANNEKIRFLPPIASAEICSFTNSYDLGIFLLPPVNFNYLHALPNKFFEFIQARLGIIISPNPEMANLVRKYKLGVVAQDYTPESMAKAINKLSTHQIVTFKKNSNLAAKVLSAEENMKKINKLVSGLVF